MSARVFIGERNCRAASRARVQDNPLKAACLRAGGRVGVILNALGSFPPSFQNFNACVADRTDGAVELPAELGGVVRIIPAVQDFNGGYRAVAGNRG